MLPQISNPTSLINCWPPTLILFIFSASYGLLLYYVSSSLVLSIFCENINLTRKLVFSALCGICVDTFFTYIIFFVDLLTKSNILSSDLLIQFITTTNPASVCIFYYLSIKILRLRRSSAIHFILLLYICVLMSRMSRNFMSCFIFAQKSGEYNYMRDVLSITASHIVNIIIYFLVMTFLQKSKFKIKLPDEMNNRFQAREIALSVILIIASYLAAVIVPVLLYNNPIGYFLLTIVFGLIFIIAFLLNTKLAMNETLANKDIYIQSLTNANDKFKLIKHDFYNILSTYSGYIQIGDIEKLKKYHEELLNTTVEAGDLLDLNNHMNENPALISLIISKIEQAKKVKVNMRVNILCNVDKHHIDRLALSRAIACLLDNALEAACESSAKRASLIIDQVKSGAKRILITNSFNKIDDITNLTVPGFTTKEGHSGLGLKEARRIFEEYGCYFKLSQIDDEFTVYIEIPAESQNWRTKQLSTETT